MSTIKYLESVLSQQQVVYNIVDNYKGLVVPQFGIRFTQMAKGLRADRMRISNYDGETPVRDLIPAKVLDHYLRLIIVMQRLSDAVDNPYIKFRINMWHDDKAAIRQCGINVYVAIPLQGIACELLNADDNAEIRRTEHQLVKTLEHQEYMFNNVASIHYPTADMAKHGFDVPKFERWWEDTWPSRRDDCLNVGSTCPAWDESDKDCAEIRKNGYSEATANWDDLPILGMPSGWVLNIGAVRNYITSETPDHPAFQRFENELQDVQLYAWMEKGKEE